MEFTIFTIVTAKARLEGTRFGALLVRLFRVRCSRPEVDFELHSRCCDAASDFGHSPHKRSTRYCGQPHRGQSVNSLRLRQWPLAVMDVQKIVVSELGQKSQQNHLDFGGQMWETLAEAVLETTAFTPKTLVRSIWVVGSQ
jgi:hypothetical protein